LRFQLQAHLGTTRQVKSKHFGRLPTANRSWARARELRSERRKSRSPTSPTQRRTKLDAVIAVHVEKIDGSATFRSQAEDASLKDPKVLAPNMLTWVVEGGNQASVGIDRSDVRSLLQVAPDTAKTQVVVIVRAVVLTSNDVIDLVREH
jgi:hypothetical protein